MDLMDYLSTLRRRWALVVVPLVLGIVAAWLTMPHATVTTPVGRSYNATATIVLDQDPTDFSQSGKSDPVSLATVALFAQTGDVPERAAKTLGFSGSAAQLATQVSFTADRETDSLQIRSSGQDARQVTDRVNAFAQATVAYFHDRQTSQAKSSLNTVQSQLTDVTQQLQAAQKTLGSDPKNVAASGEASALRPQYTNLIRQRNELQQNANAGGPLELLQKASPIAVDTGGITAPRGSFGRLGVAALLALLVGIALALVVDRFDTRMHTRRRTEETFDLPVIADVPPLARRRRRPQVATQTDPNGLAAEAFRQLRSALMVLGPARADATTEPTVVLVTSARRREGRTTVVANLAGVLAEAGQRVLVLSTDLRHPDLHAWFGVDDGPGVSDLLTESSEHDFLSLVRATDVPRVEIVTGGTASEQPRALLTSAEQLIAEARRYADVVLLDSPAAIGSSDATDLAQFSDVVLVVSRLHRTTVGVADALRIQMQRLRIPALGVVLVGSRSGVGGAGSRSRGTTEAELPAGWAFDPRDGRRENVGSEASDAAAPRMPSQADRRGSHTADRGRPPAPSTLGAGSRDDR